MGKKNLRRKVVSLDCITRRYDQVFFDTCAMDGYNNSVKNVYALYEHLSKGNVFFIISGVKEEFLHYKKRDFLLGKDKVKDWMIREKLVALLEEKGLVCDDPDEVCPYVEGRLTLVDANVFSGGYDSSLNGNKAAIITIDEMITDAWKDSMRHGYMVSRGIGIHDFSMFKRINRDGYKKIFP